ncbi:glycosyltransferase family 9 protein [Flavobacterium sp. N1718]|uniref:glycosyltransferase family 9 protein n=1 Tax=unclassified Flavobacterium TaxID=196869 RepID=UPI0029CAB9EA|nr:glycosyltransferase family 9 protein [Flavobacterium sp. N1718]
MPSLPQHIAVMRLSAMGDVAMTVPVLRAFRKRYPEVRLTVVSTPFLKPLFDALPGVTFVPFDKKAYKGVFGLFRFYRKLKATGIDAFADVHSVTRSRIIGLFFTLSGYAVARLDKGRSEKKALTRPHNKMWKPLKTSPERYADVFRSLGYPLDLFPAEFPQPQPLSDAVWAVTGPKTGRWIGIAPFAQHAPKVYPEDLMQDVINALATWPDVKVLLFGGGKEETARLQAIADSSPHLVNVAGRLSFADELLLISHLDVMLSMDSGNGHLAAIAGVPVVTLWGATHPYAGFAPFGQPLSNSLCPDRERYPMLPTSVFGNKEVVGYEDAMRTIRPDLVVEKIKELLP